MFFEQHARAARKHGGVPCAERYVAFRDYPLADYMRLVADCGCARCPALPLRQALRRVGWEAVPTLMSSLAGRVIFAFAGPRRARGLAPRAGAYEHGPSHGSVRSRLDAPGQVVLEYRDVWNFPESYHVGAIEGGCRAFGAAPRVRRCVRSACSLDADPLVTGHAGQRSSGVRQRAGRGRAGHNGVPHPTVRARTGECE